MAGDEVPSTEAVKRESSTQQQRNPNIWHTKLFTLYHFHSCLKSTIFLLPRESWSPPPRRCYHQKRRRKNVQRQWQLQRKIPSSPNPRKKGGSQIQSWTHLTNYQLLRSAEKKIKPRDLGSRIPGATLDVSHFTTYVEHDRHLVFPQEKERRRVGKYIKKMSSV
jgi:hypothetical protein